MGYMEGTKARIYGRVLKIFFSAPNTGWTACKIVMDSGGCEGLVGIRTDDVQVGSWIVADVMYVFNRKYGLQWEARKGHLIHLSLQSLSSFVSYCRQDDVLQDMSRYGMTLLWNKYGRDVILELDSNGVEAASEAGCSTADIAVVKTAVDAKGPAPILRSGLPHLDPRHVDRISADILAHSESVHQARELAAKTITELKSWRQQSGGGTDPFRTLCGLWHLSFQVADEVFMEDLGGQDFSDCRIGRILRHAVNTELNRQTWANYIPIDENPAIWEDFRLYGFFGVKTSARHPIPFVSPEGYNLASPDGFTRFVESRATTDACGIRVEAVPYGAMKIRRLYTISMLYAETLCAQRIAEASVMTRGMLPPPDMKTWDALDDDQKAAVRMVLNSRISFVTGGPGSGKTSMIGALVEAWKLIHPSDGEHNIMILAPTGKAANRAKSAAYCACAGTIARLFAKNDILYAPFGSVDEILNIKNKTALPGVIEAVTSGEFMISAGSLVVIDEASMIGVETGGKLMHLLDGCNLVFVGDADQLPPIDHGAFFRECLDSNRARVTRLTHNHRVEKGGNRALPAAAAKVRAGEYLEEDDFTNLNPGAGRLGRNDLVILLDSDANGGPDKLSSGEKSVINVFRSYLRNGVDPKDIMVLSPFRGSAPRGSDQSRRFYPLCTYNLNGLLQDVVNPYDSKRSYRAFNGTDGEGDYISGRGQITGVLDSTGRELRIGDRILNLSNSPDLSWQQYEGGDYLRGQILPQPDGENLGVFNGEGGIIRRVYMPVDRGRKHSKPCRVLVELDDIRSETEQKKNPMQPKWLLLPTEPLQKGNKLENWCLGYAMTVHKSQGCEAPYVIIALSDLGYSACIHNNTFMTRNLLNTAMTRASEECIIVGNVCFLDACVSTPCECRFIALKDRIRRGADLLAGRDRR